ncbi:hypothetical protein [Caldalkalibacillus mannanilyticus]|uniref:hypothetical protein n=1 Tax=Caldalkalibacillus mannanilyticus TaxID=1418 RepID=UPI00046AC2D7|nr:hypothetical protein [Caldalkalibacillus mannanilyticus]
MKRITIGGILMFFGTLICLTIIILASQFVPMISEWRGTKLWFLIFGAKDLNHTYSLFLGTPFIIGTILFTLGLIVLLVELYFEYRKNLKIYLSSKKGKQEKYEKIPPILILDEATLALDTKTGSKLDFRK